jgi:hypothetical protein
MNHVELVQIRGGVSDSGEVVVHLWDRPFQHPSAGLAYGLDPAAVSESYDPPSGLSSTYARPGSGSRQMEEMMSSVRLTSPRSTGRY